MFRAMFCPKHVYVYSTHSATLPLTVFLPTTTTGYHMLSHAPDDGQNIARNMLS